LIIEEPFDGSFYGRSYCIASYSWSSRKSSNTTGLSSVWWLTLKSGFLDISPLILREFSKSWSIFRHYSYLMNSCTYSYIWRWC
jgi:hypothetical protein